MMLKKGLYFSQNAFSAKIYALKGLMGVRAVESHVKYFCYKIVITFTNYAYKKINSEVLSFVNFKKITLK